ncbi:hypothetical protein [Azospirillum sp. ST 5-10]|uniref:hypothetical protein n=1 Tax=unclassified Azospirillum TaxID=2630922 RepID=UPI003F4A1400
MAMRTRNALVAVKIESSEGVYASPSAATDAVLVENPRPTPRPNQIETNEVTGSLDPFEDLVAGMMFDLTFDSFLKGSGTPGTAAEWGNLWKATGGAEVITASAVPASAEAASAGSGTTLTLGSSAAGTAQIYRYMPLLLGTNPAGGATTFVTDYTSGKVATLADSFDPALDNTTTYQIPVNVLYLPASDDIPSVSMDVYMDGIKYAMAGCRGRRSLRLEANGVGRFSWTFSGVFVSKTDVAVPTGVFDATRPPVWKGGVFTWDRKPAALKTLTFEDGGQVTMPDNPNSEEGYDPAVITGRKWTGSMDPLMTLVATRNVLADVRAGTNRILHARLGTAAGNRIGITAAQTKPLNETPGDRSGLLTGEVPLQYVGQDSGLGICIF